MTRLEELQKEMELAEKLLKIYVKITELKESNKIQKHPKAGWLPTPPFSCPRDWDGITLK